MRIPAARRVFSAVAAVLATSVLTFVVREHAPPDSFDELYARGQKVNAAIKTLTARFTETTTSSLLTKPIIGTRPAVRSNGPSRVVLRYTDPDARVSADRRQHA